MPKKIVYLYPGFGASDLGVLATGDKLWWDPNLSPAQGLLGMALADNGFDPYPDGGKQMGVVRDPQNPWPTIKTLLESQLDPDTWQVSAGPYDWRLDIQLACAQVATLVRSNSTAEFPGTIVGHSMGGLVALGAWKIISDAGEGNKVRRVITMGTPFQGSYMPILWLIGASGIVTELTAIYGLVNVMPGVNPANWTLAFLNFLALTWPSFYELYPFALGDEAQSDPNRQLLYNSANYPVSIRPKQAWLDYSKNTFQPFITGAVSAVPPWIMTSAAGIGLGTPRSLSSPSTPLRLQNLGMTSDGDGIVTADSALLANSVRVTVPSNHSSLPLGMAASGELAGLIRDERVPPAPPPPTGRIRTAISLLVSDPPMADDVSPILCVGGG